MTHFPTGDPFVNDSWTTALDRLLTPPRPRCLPARTTRTLVGRDRRVVPVSALGGAR
ncbi:hypothetical protein [Umezawaea sp. NPDC059074]|uniref:hypothetical protein n=1 Tax=Umezawaea sp. NPDC059074 TaxID=3346716 RepID=UPI0036C4EA5E